MMQFVKTNLRKICTKYFFLFCAFFYQKSIDKVELMCYIIITERENNKNKKERVYKMINIRTINKLQDNDGITLKNGQIVTYKTGWQVATEGIEATTTRDAINAVKAFGGNCGVWLANGIYYVDKSKRVNTKKEALAIGRACKQISIFGWARKNLAYC